MLYASWRGRGALVVAEKDKVARALAAAIIGRYRVERYMKIPVYVGQGYYIMGVRGHLMDVDFVGYSRWDYDTIEGLFDAKLRLVLREGITRYVKAIKHYARMVDSLYLALDNDYEGEFIAWEVLRIAKEANPHIRALRVRFSSLDPVEIRQAFEQPDSLNRYWIEKVSARQEVDLRSGAVFTRLLTLAFERRMKLPKGRFLSYGPCQSPTLRLIVEPYLRWEAGAKYKYELELVLRHPLYGDLKLTKTFKEEAEAERHRMLAVRDGKAVVVDVRQETSLMPPPVPLDAYELASRAARFLKIPSKRTMDAAEELYRRGLISYPRTETQKYRGVDVRRVLSRLTKLPNPELSRAAAELLAQPVLRAREGRRDDRAHPPIHPVRAAGPADFGPGERELMAIYELVVRHFMATFMPPAKVLKRKAILRIGGLTLEVRGLKVLEPGYLRVYKYEWPEESELWLRRGDVLTLVRARVRRVRVTPEYLDESELIRIMRAKGIGTDSTMHEHIQTNIDRGYAVRRRGKLIPTPLGIALVKALLKVAPELVDVNLRAWMEGLLAQVGEGTRDRDEVVREILDLYRKAYVKLRQHIDWVAEQLVEAYKEASGNRLTHRLEGGEVSKI